MKKSLLLLAIIVGGYFVVAEEPPGTLPPSQTSVSDQALADAFAQGRSGLQLDGRGRVTRVLSDDNDGDRHQRFIVQLDSGQTLLVAHNINLAPRVPGLEPGDTIEFRGEYEWNSEGGVIHWTHSDPAGRHTPGWIRHGGRTYP